MPTKCLWFEKFEDHKCNIFLMRFEMGSNDLLDYPGLFWQLQKQMYDAICEDTNKQIILSYAKY